MNIDVKTEEDGRPNSQPEPETPSISEPKINQNDNIFGIKSPEPKKQAPKPPKSRKKRNYITVLMVIVVLGLTGGAGYLYYQNQQSKKEVAQAKNEIERLSNTEQIIKEEQEKLINSVSAITELPKDETPTIATVSDPTKAKSQPFLKDAEAGDKVLIFTKAQKAYLYRPSTNKIINIAPVTFGTGKSTGTTNNTTTNKNTQNQNQ